MIRTKKIVVVAIATCVIALLCASCKSPVPAQVHDFSPYRDFTNDYDTVWTSVIDHFASQNVSIKNLEKASGLIVAERQYADPQLPYFDCGRRASGEVYTGVRGEFNVFVRPRTEEADVQRITVNTNYWVSINRPGGLLRPARGTTSRQCNSTGELEQQLLNAFRARLEVYESGN